MPTPTPEAITPIYQKAAGLFLLSGVLIAGGAITLALGMGNLWGIAVAFVGVAVCVWATMAGIFAGTATNQADKFRFNSLTILGILMALVGVAMWWKLGGLTGAGAGVVIFGVGTFVVGGGIMCGAALSSGGK